MEINTLTLPRLSAAVRENNIAPLYVVKGEDAYFKSRAVEIIKGIVPSDFAVMNISSYETRPDVYELINALSTEPLFSAWRVVTVGSWQDKALMSKDKSALFKFLSNPPDFSVLVVTDDSDIFSEMLRKDEAAAKKAVMVDCKKAERADVIDWIKIKGARAGVLFEDAAAARLADFTKGVMTRVAMETEKLTAFASGGRITAADVETLVAPELDVQIYELSNALAGGQPWRAWGVLASVEKLGYKETHILAAVMSQFRRMFYAAESEESDYSLAQTMGVKNYSVHKDREAGRRYRPGVLKRCVEMLDEQEFLLKTGKIGKDNIIRDTVARLISAK
ncbi:MAG: DNA polymerase III subunit delta [Clostridiales bacterium]|jgi:DNA polymerase-3 subunit delta|nr:DNA polymerase III subunit delta [Clostridiales bacterium]